MRTLLLGGALAVAGFAVATPISVAPASAQVAIDTAIGGVRVGPQRPILLGSTFNEAAYESAFKSMEQDRANALLVSDENEHFAYRATLFRLVAERRLPAIYPIRTFVDSGGLMTYAANLGDFI